MKQEVKTEGDKKLFYKKLGRHYIGDAIRNAHHKCKLTAAQYHKNTKMLVTGKLSNNKARSICQTAESDDVIILYNFERVISRSYL